MEPPIITPAHGQITAPGQKPDGSVIIPVKVKPVVVPSTKQRSPMSDQVKRALHTFWQAFIPVFLGGLFNVAHVYGQNGAAGIKSAVVALVVAAVAAGLSAVKSLVV